jgi:hypothetical protein
MQKLQMVLSKAVYLITNSYESMPWDNSEFYANYLAQTFYYVRHSTRLLALSASRLSYQDQQGLHLRFLKHLGEEANHEQLVLNDLKNLGYTPKDFQELLMTKLFYESQYYKIEHQSPLALMGYILYLEVLAQNICPPLSKIIINVYGSKVASFLLIHGNEDPQHVAEAQKVLSDIDPDSLKIITENLEQSSYAFNLIVREILEKTQKENWKKSA